MTDAAVPHSLTDGVVAVLPPEAQRPRIGRKLVLTVLAVLAFGAALLDAEFGMIALIPFGLFLAFSIDTDEMTSRRSVILTRRNLVMAAAMVAAFGCFWLWREHLGESMLVAIAAALIAMPLALEESAADETRERTVVVTKRSLIISLVGLVSFAFVYQDGGVWLFGLAAVCVVLPQVLAVSRAWGAGRGRIEFGLLRHPLRRETRAHLLQALNIWLCCALLGGVIAAGGTHSARILFSLNESQFYVVFGAFAVGLVVLAALALVPRRRVYVATNVVVALLSGFVAVQLVSISVPSGDAVTLGSPVAGEWFVQNGGRSVLLNGHLLGENQAVDLQQMGANGRTHTGGNSAPLTDYVGFGMPVFAPADGRIVEVTDKYDDLPPGTNGDEANHLVIDIGGDRYVSMAHLKRGSVKVQVGSVVRRGQPIAAVGNNGHSSAPHLHFQVQDSPASTNAERTYPMVFRDVHIARGGVWPWGDSGELRTGDLVSPVGP